MAPITGIQAEQSFTNLIDRNDLLGKGTARHVYAVSTSKDFVIKESILPFHYSNFVEWTVWTALEKMKEDLVGNTPNATLSDQFARCFAISESGRYLMMERLNSLNSTQTQPASHTLPDWLNDRKKSAFGADRNGNVKVMDYGMVDFYKILNPKNYHTI